MIHCAVYFWFYTLFFSGCPVHMDEAMPATQRMLHWRGWSWEPVDPNWFDNIPILHLLQSQRMPACVVSVAGTQRPRLEGSESANPRGGDGPAAHHLVAHQGCAGSPDPGRCVFSHGSAWLKATTFMRCFWCRCTTLRHRTRTAAFRPAVGNPVPCWCLVLP